MAEEKLTLPQPDYNLQERIRQDSVDINPIDLSMPYEDFTKYLPDNENLVDDQYRRSVAEYTQFFDQVSPVTYANSVMGAQASVINTDPTRNLTPEESMDKLFKAPLEENPGSLPKPIYANARTINFDKIYESDTFSDIGFTPYANMDAILNTNETFGDSLSRGLNPFFSLFRSGRYSGYRSIADFFDGDGYDSPDLTGAATMEDAMRIGGSTTGSVAGFLGNTGLNFAYSAGIIYQIAVEEVIGAGIAAVGAIPSGGTTLAGFGALTLKNLAQLTRIPQAIARGYKASTQLLRSIRSIENARDFYNVARTGANFTGRLIAPELAHTIKNWKTTGNTFQNLYNIGKNTDVFGAFYRDMRMYNAALSEAKMEAGMVYNQVLESGMREKNAQNAGKGVSADDIREIQIAANNASWKTLAPNFAIIAASNRIVFKNVFGSWAKRLNRNTAANLQRILKVGPGKHAVKSKWALVALPQELKAAFSVGSWKRGAKVAAGVMLRYGVKGMVEGAQEVSQEAVSAATGGYYSSLLRGPLAGGPNTLSGFYGAAGKEIFTKEGFQTFASGFLIGGLMGPYQQVLFQGVPAIYSKARASASSSKKFGRFFGQEVEDMAAKQRQTEEQVVNDVVNSANELSGNFKNSLHGILGPKNLNLQFQDQADGIANLSLALNDKYDYFNNRFDSRFMNMYSKYMDGTISLYRDSLNDFSKMSDKELSEAFNESDLGRKPQRLREEIAREIARVDQFGERIAKKGMNEFFDSKKINMVDIPKDGKAYRDAMFFNRAIDQTKMLYIFANESFVDAIQRQKNIEAAFANEPIFAKQAYGDIRVLVNAETIKTEIGILDKEIAALEDGGGDQAVINKKKRKRKDLDRYVKVLTDPKNLTKKGFFDRRKTAKIEGPLKQYLSGIAGENADFINPDNFQNLLEELTDHAALQEDAFAFSQSANYLSTPEGMMELVNRNEEYYQYLYKNRAEVYRKQTEAYLATNKKNILINDLAKLEVYMSPDLIRAFLSDEIGADGLLEGLASGQFSIDGRAIGGALNLDVDQELSNDIIALINTYRLTTELEVKAEEFQEQQKEEAQIDVEEKLVDAGVDVNIGDTSRSSILQSVLEREYRKYKESAFDKDSKSFADWRLSEDGVRIKTAFDALKRIWGKGYDITVEEGGQKVDRKRIPTQKELASESGFQNYLNSREAREEPLVQDVLRSLDLNIDIFTTTQATGARTQKIPQGGEGIAFNIVQVDTPDGAFYKIVDKQGIDLNESQLGVISDNFEKTGTYTTMAQAIADRDILDREISGGDIFLFDGMQLSKGISVFDKITGEEFRVNSIENKGGQIYLVPAEFYNSDYKVRNSNSKAEIELDFSRRYELEKLVFNTLPKNASKLFSNRLDRAYAKTLPGDSPGMAADRLRAIVDVLKPEEFSQLIVNFDVNPLAEQPIDDDRFNAGQDVVPNDYIRKQRERFTISLRLPVSVLADVNIRLNELQITPIPQDGIFAYLPNDSLYFQDGQKKTVDPSVMTPEFARNIIIPADGQSIEQAIEQVAEGFAKQAALISVASDKISSDEDAGVLGEGLQVIRNEGIPAYRKGTNPEIPLAELQYKTNSTGDIIIYDISRDKQGNAIGDPIVMSNLSGQQKNELAEKVENGLKNNGLWAKMMSGEKEGPLGGYTDRYIMAVQSPGGVYTLATAKAPYVGDDQLSAMMNDILQQASVARKDNKEGYKNRGFNDEFNKAFQEKYGDFFISSTSGNKITIDVAPDGAIRATVFNRNTGKDHTSFYEMADQQKEGTPIQHLDRIFKKLLDDAPASFNLTTLSKANYKRSIPLDMPIDEMLQTLTTKLGKEVRVGQYIEFTADASAIQGAKDKGIILARPRSEQDVVPIREESPEAARARKIAEMGDKISQDAIDEAVAVSEETGDPISDDVFSAFVDNNLSDAQKAELVESIAQNIMAGIELSPRQQDIRKVISKDIEQYLKDNVTEQQNNDILATLKAETPLDAVNRSIQEREAEIIKEVGEKKKIKALRADKVYQDLIKERDKLIKPSNKVLSENDFKLSAKDVEDIDVFKSWARQNLPDFIGIGDVESLGNNMKAGGVRVGAFVLDMASIGGGLRAAGTIYTGASNPFRYHEAFHGVYQMLLTPQQQQELLAEAKKEKRAELRKAGLSLNTELEKFKNSADEYAAMDKAELENRYYEEYMADQFELFKTGPKNSKASAPIKSFFTRILEWFKRIFGSYTQTQLQTLFQKIDSGKFADASVIANDFTLDPSPKVIISNAILPYEALQVNSQKGQLYLESSIANPIVRVMAASYVARKVSNDDPSISNDQIFEEVLEDFAWLYNKNNPVNSKYSDSSNEANIVAVEQLDKIHNALTYDVTEDIKDSPVYKAVFEVLEIIDVQRQIEEDVIDEFENNEGLRNVTQFGKEAYMSGGLSSLPTYIRQYLATITMPYTDVFGNEVLDNGEKLVIPIDAYQTYNGITKAVKNIQDPLKIMQAMYIFSNSNPNTKAAVRAIFNDIGINYDSITEINELQLPQTIKNPLLFNQITKGFSNYKVDWLFLQQDNTNNTVSFSAAERDDIHTQNELWGQAYTTKSMEWKINPQLKKNALGYLDDLRAELTQPKGYSGNQDGLENLSRNLAQNVYDGVGIKLSPLYIQFSILSNSTQTKNAAQSMLLSFNDMAKPIDPTGIYFIREIINKDGDLFNSENDGAIARLKTLAINNAIFDESIGLSVFKNVNGDLVNAHQKPTFHLERVFALNTETEIDKLAADKFLENNYLLNNLEFLNMSDDNLLKIQRLSGLKEVKTLDRSKDYDSYISGVLQTTEYGSFTPKQFVTSLVNNYTVDYVARSNSLRTRMDDGAVAPVLIRVMESSNTGDMISLPVVQAVSGTNAQVTAAYVDAISDFVENEYNRILRENDPETANLPLQNVTTKDGREITIAKEIPGYNIPDVDGIMRKNLMFNVKDLITPETKKALEIAATSQNPVSFKKALTEAGISNKKYRKELTDQLNAKFDRFRSLLDSTGAIDKIGNDIKNGLVQGVEGAVAQEKARDAAKKLNLRSNENYNLRQIFFNDFLNTKSLNELLLGDQALILEDSIKQIKRAKGQNAAGDSIYSPVSNSKMGVNEPTEQINAVILKEAEITSEFSGNTIDRGDAQVYVTSKFHRHAQNSLGTLTEAGARAITKIENGDQLTQEELFGPQGLANTGQMLNSKKYVYFDGNTYVKFSAITLTEDFTKNNPELDRLRLQLEAMDSDLGGISMAGFESAFKMLKTNVQVLGDEITQPSIILDARNFREQVKNPSNKIKVSEQSQMKVLVTSEQVDDTPVTIEGRPDIKNIGDVRKEYNKVLSNRIILKFKNKRNLVYSFEGLMSEFALSKDRNKLTPNLQTFLRYATNSLKASKASSNLLEFFSVDPKTGEIKFNLNNPISGPKAEQLFMSYFSKEVFQEKIPGHGLALVSDQGFTVIRRIFSMEDNGRLGRNEVLRDGVPEGESLAEVKVEDLTNGNIPKEGLIVRDRLRYQLREYNEQGQWTGQYYSEAVLPAHSADIYSQLQNNKSAKIPGSIGKMFGVRIPSQDNHSSMNIKLVDFMPAYFGSSAMFPAELVEISGADFDIDKAYVQVKDSYYDEEAKQFFAYGETPGREYSDYVRYINQEVEKDTVYAEAEKSFRDQGSKLEDSYTDAELIDSDFSNKAIRAASRLGLPITRQQYQKYKAEYGEPYEAPLNNAALDYKFALMGNEAVKDISVTPATLTAVEQAYEELKVLAPDYVARLDNENIDVDSLTGKTISYEVNKGAAIGKAVSPNLYLSLLSEYKIALPGSLQFSLRGEKYSGYGNYVNTYGIRKQDEISSIITMLTDNSKENYVAKLGMHPSAVGIATNMVALGVPLTDAVLLLNGKTVRDLFEQAENKTDKFDPSFKSLIKERLRLLKGTNTVAVNETLLEKNLKDETLTKEEDFSILQILDKMNSISGFTGAMSSITSMSGNGIGRNFSDIQQRLDSFKTIGVLAAEKRPLMDIGPILTNSWVKSNIDVFLQVAQELVPTTFITGTETFMDIYDDISVNLSTDKRAFTADDQQKVKRDMLSFFTIQAYLHNSGNSETKGAATLTNNLIYPSEGQTIFNAVQRLTESDPDNFFLRQFVTMLPINAEKNNTGLNLLQANTWRGLNKQQKLDLQTSFTKLYGNPISRRDAMTIVNYIMVKDGLQQAKGSLLDAISPFVISEYLQTVNNVNQVFLNNEGYEDTFGMNREDLVRYFEDGYFRSNVVGPYIKTLNLDVGDRGIAFDRKGFQLRDQKLVHTAQKDESVSKFYNVIDYTQPMPVSTFYTLQEVIEKKLKNGDIVNQYIYQQDLTMGSNYQNGIGFMFGARDTNKAVIQNIKDRGQTRTAYGSDINFDDVVAEDFAPQPRSLQQRALSNENAMIEATEDNIDFVAEDTSRAINIADVTELSSILSQEGQAEENVQTEAEGVEAAQENLPEESQLVMDFEADISEKYPGITQLYNTIFVNPYLKGGSGLTGELATQVEVLENNNLDTLEKMIAFYESPQQNFADEAAFEDYVKRCLLG